MKKIKIILTILVISLLIVLSIVIIRKNKKENLLPDSISSITIEYYPGYNITTAESLNSLHDYNYIEKQIIQLNEEEINNIKKEFSNIYDDTEEFSKCECVISDDYKMIINNDYELIIDEHWGQYKYLEKNTIINIPDNLYDYVSSKVEKNNTKIFKTLEANTLSIEKDNVPLTVNKELKDDFLNKFTYLEVNINENYLTYDDGYVYVLYFDDNRVLYLYSGCVIGYLVDNDSNYSSYILVNGITEKDVKDILLSIEENNETKIKYLEYVEENGYSVSGVKFIINVDEEIIAKQYYLSQETFEYEEIDKQIWSKQKWINLEKELYDSGLESWKTKQEELDNKYDENGGWPTDGDTYKLYIVFNDDSKLQLSAYWFSAFDIEDILNKYFSK